MSACRAVAMTSALCALLARSSSSSSLLVAASVVLKRSRSADLMGRQSAHRSAPLAAQLLAATREGDLLRLHLLLKNNTAEGLVNEQLECYQRTALNEAVELGNEAVVVLLLAQCVACVA